MRKQKGLLMSDRGLENIWAHVSLQNICLVSTVPDECMKTFSLKNSVCGGGVGG